MDWLTTLSHILERGARAGEESVASRGPVGALAFGGGPGRPTPAGKARVREWDSGARRTTLPGRSFPRPIWSEVTWATRDETAASA